MAWLPAPAQELDARVGFATTWDRVCVVCVCVYCMAWLPPLESSHTLGWDHVCVCAHVHACVCACMHYCVFRACLVTHSLVEHERLTSAAQSFV
jgi:hypothetical protein